MTTLLAFDKSVLLLNSVIFLLSPAFM